MKIHPQQMEYARTHGKRVYSICVMIRKAFPALFWENKFIPVFSSLTHLYSETLKKDPTDIFLENLTYHQALVPLTGFL